MMSSIIEDHHCKTQLKEEIFYYTWSIDNFLTLFKFGDVFNLNSSKSKNNFEFFMYCEQDKVKFYGLLSQSKDSKFSTSFYSVFLKTNYGKMCKKQFAKYSISKTTLLFDLPISFFIDNAIMYLPNGTLTIYFEFHTLIDVINSDVNYSYRALAITDTDILVPNEMSNQFVTFVVNEETLQANKILLCLKSKVFKAMFECGLKESQINEIEITDIRYDILKELLSFILTDDLSNHIWRDAEAICELFIAADKYDIENLKLICEQNIIKIITIENVIKYLEFAYLNNATVLTKYAKDFIKLYYKDIMDTPNFITLMQEYPELLIQIKNIQLPITNVDTIGNFQFIAQ